MLDQKKACIFLPLFGTFILILSLIPTHVLWYMQLIQLAVTMLGALMIGVGLVLIKKIV